MEGGPEIARDDLLVVELPGGRMKTCSGGYIQKYSALVLSDKSNMRIMWTAKYCARNLGGKNNKIIFEFRFKIICWKEEHKIAKWWLNRYQEILSLAVSVSQANSNKRCEGWMQISFATKTIMHCTKDSAVSG